MKLTRYLCLLTLLFTVPSRLCDADVISPVEDGLFNDVSSHRILTLDDTSVGLWDAVSNISSMREPYAVFNFPIAGLETGLRKLRFTFTKKPTGDTGDPLARSETHEFSIRVKAGDGVVTYADFFDIPPDLDVQALEDGSLFFPDVIAAGASSTFTNLSVVDTVAYQVDDADAGTVVESNTAAFSDALNELILHGHTHAMVLLQFDSFGVTEIATLENDLYPSAQIVHMPEPGTAVLMGLSALVVLRIRRRSLENS